MFLSILAVLFVGCRSIVRFYSSIKAEYYFSRLSNSLSSFPSGDIEACFVSIIFFAFFFSIAVAYHYYLGRLMIFDEKYTEVLPWRNI